MSDQKPFHIPDVPDWAMPPIGKPEATEDEIPPSLSSPGRHDVDRKKRLTDEKIEDRKAERDLRRTYANRAFWFAVGGIVFWAALLIWTGCATYYRDKAPFSDNVLIAITTATSINLFAAFLGVIRGLFPVKGRASEK